MRINDQVDLQHAQHEVRKLQNFNGHVARILLATFSTLRSTPVMSSWFTFKSPVLHSACTPGDQLFSG